MSHVEFPGRVLPRSAPVGADAAKATRGATTTTLGHASTDSLVKADGAKRPVTIAKTFPEPLDASIVANAARYSLSPAQCSAIIVAVHGVSVCFPWVTTNLVHLEEHRPGLFQESMGSSHVEERVYQFTITAPWEAREEKARVISVIQAGFDAAGVKLRVSDAGDALLFGNAEVDKSLALANYASQLGVHEDRIAKFGDKAGATGNDKHLRGAHAYNVGKDHAHLPEVSDKVRGQHAHGTVAVVHELLAANDIARAAGKEPPVRAFMFDFDGTLTIPGSHGIAPEALDMLVTLLERGQDFAICTGRGPALFPLVLDQLIARGVSGDLLSRHMSIFMFNGARPLLPQEMHEVVAQRLPG